MSFDARYRVKQIIDTFGYRTAKGSSAGVLALVGLFAKIPGAAFSVVAMVMAGFWSVFVSKVTKRYQDLEVEKNPLMKANEGGS